MRVSGAQADCWNGGAAAPVVRVFPTMGLCGEKAGSLALGLDFGGTKLLAGVVDTSTGEVLAGCERPTPVERGARASLQEMIECANTVLENPRLEPGSLRGIGISFGGPVRDDRRAVVKSMHVSGWEDLPLPDMVTSILGLPAIMDNDANAAALAEARLGSTGPMRELVYVQVSTGIGSGLVLGGRVHRGQGQAGELGHMTIDADGPMCVCGRRGCLESIASGWAIAQQGREELASAGPSAILRQVCGDSRDRLSARHVLLAAERGDGLARSIVRRALSALGSAMATLICLLDPQVIVMGGGLGMGIASLADELKGEVDRHLPATLAGRSRVVFSHFGGNAALVGAACLLDEGVAQ